jgi:TrmH family RNA methyltransferase
VGIQDPGNAGTLIRVAEATGCVGVLLSAGSVDVWNPKVVRASAGSILRVPVVEGLESDELLAVARGSELRSVGTTATGGSPPESLDLSGAVMLLVGSEAHGLPEGMVGELELRATIPMQGEVESLNAAVAGSLLAFEAARQRRGAASGGSPETDYGTVPPDGPE